MLSNFQCSQCGQSFTLQSGLMTRDLMDVQQGSELPGGAKLPDEETFTQITNSKTTQATFDFNNDLDAHQRICKGEVKLIHVVFAH